MQLIPDPYLHRNKLDISHLAFLIIHRFQFAKYTMEMFSNDVALIITMRDLSSNDKDLPDES